MKFTGRPTLKYDVENVFFCGCICSNIQCLLNRKQDEALRKKMKSCALRRAQAMKDLKTCDCNERDYENTLLTTTGPLYIKYFRCLSIGRFKIKIAE